MLYIKRGNVSQTAQDISVIICAFTEERWSDLVAAVESARQQTVQPREIIIVIDYNTVLLKQVQEHLVDVIAIENRQGKGASGARNSGVAVAHGEVLAFLDDDAIAEPNWLESLAECYADPKVVGVGGEIKPLWLGARPYWFPEEFNWVVGCTYRGMPTKNAPVRNIIGANMSVRRSVLTAIGGFRTSFGNNKGKSITHSPLKWLQHHAGDEETELCIRAAQHWLEGIWLYTPTASVKHHVPAKRTCWRYFLWRCYDEGLGKAQVVKLHGGKRGLSSERIYTFKVLPQGAIHGLSDALIHQDLSGLARAGAIASGLVATIIGFFVGSFFSKAWVKRT